MATQQYVVPGLSFLNVAVPGDFFGAGSVVCDANGVPGRGFADDLGVEIKTGTWYCGKPASVTKTFAVLIVGFGVNETLGPGVGVVEDP